MHQHLGRHCGRPEGALLHELSYPAWPLRLEREHGLPLPPDVSLRLLRSTRPHEGVSVRDERGADSESLPGPLRRSMTISYQGKSLRMEFRRLQDTDRCAT